MQHLVRTVAVVWIVLFSLNLSAHPNESDVSFEEDALTLYNAIDFSNAEKPAFDLFHLGFTGYLQLKQLDQLRSNEKLTLIDFRKPSTEKRLWVIDLAKRKTLHYSLVAHGKNSGDLYAKTFSNKNNSHQSSLGFYKTGATYIGKHGLSLKLHGLEPGVNDKAEARAIVMHGADYVSESFIKKVGRLGRSFGCPAVPSGLHKDIINDIAGGSCLFIYYPDREYLQTTLLQPVKEITNSSVSGLR